MVKIKKYALCDFITELGIKTWYTKATKKKGGLKMSVIKVNSHNFNNEVMDSDKKVLIDFFADWCGPCRMVSPIVDAIADERADIKVVKINVDDEPELASRFGVMSIPTLVVIDGGREVNRLLGARPKEAILAAL